MREIKFRGKSEMGVNEMQEKGISHVGRWVYGTYIHGYIIDGVIEANDEYISIEEWCPVEPDIVGQFTGLHDNYDNELYEGDIVETHRHLIKRYVVRFIDGCFVFATHYEGMCSYNPIGVFLEGDYEIIKLGNIYENPEFLEGESE